MDAGAFPPDLRMNHHALLHAHLPLKDLFQMRIEVVRVGLGDKSEAAHMDAQNRNAAGSGQPRGGQDGSVASQRHDELHLFPGVWITHQLRLLHPLSGIAIEAHMDSPRLEPDNHLLGKFERLRLCPMHYDPDATLHGMPPLLSYFTA